MPKRFVSIWFRHLLTDREVRRKPELKGIPFVLAAPERGRMVIKAANIIAEQKGIQVNMVVADCRAILPELQVFDNDPALPEKLLNALAEWCLRFTPIVAVDMPDGLLLDVSGCPHLWGGERPYLKDLVTRIRAFGYDVRAAVADTVGAAWGVARFGQITPLIDEGKQAEAIRSLPPSALRLESCVIEKLEKLGLYQIGNFMNMPRSALRRRFGKQLLLRLDQATGQEMEIIQSIKPLEPYSERLPSLEPIRTAPGIEIALRRLLEALCSRLAKENTGLRKAIFKGYRIDGIVQQIQIATNRPSRNVDHLFKLFEIKICGIMPALGIELFTLEAPIVEKINTLQDALWNSKSTNDRDIAELLDRISIKLGVDSIHRYIPDEHFWPERSMKIATSIDVEVQTDWDEDLPRPVHLLPKPEPIEVTVPVPDYPPMLFIYKGKLHNINKADGPERIEQEWWIEEGLYRDYYCVEDENGARYWLFRLGHYNSGEPKWFIHGFFA